MTQVSTCMEEGSQAPGSGLRAPGSRLQTSSHQASGFRPRYEAQILETLSATGGFCCAPDNHLSIWLNLG